MKHYIDKDTVVVEIERRKEKCDTFYNIALSNNAEFAKVAIEEQKRQYNSLLSFLDTIEVKEDSVNDDLEVELEKYIKDHFTIDTEQLDRFGIEEKDYMYSMDKSDMLALVKHFIKWQKVNLWKSADGDDLPKIDQEAIVLTQPYPLENSEYAVSFAHRPNPNGWDGMSDTTGKVEHYTPKTYDKCGWNIPDVKYWLDVEFPKK